MSAVLIIAFLRFRFDLHSEITDTLLEFKLDVKSNIAKEDQVVTNEQ